MCIRDRQKSVRQSGGEAATFKSNGERYGLPLNGKRRYNSTCYTQITVTEFIEIINNFNLTYILNHEPHEQVNKRLTLTHILYEDTTTTE